MHSSGQIEFGGILPSLVNHLQQSSLKWNNIPGSGLSIRLSVLPRFLAFYSRSLSLFGVALFSCASSVSAPSSPRSEAPRSLTDSEIMTADLSQSAVAHGGLRSH